MNLTYPCIHCRCHNGRSIIEELFVKFIPFQKILRRTIAVILPISFVACSASNPSTPPTSSSPAAAQETESQLTNISSDSSCSAAIQSAKRQLEQLQPSQIWINQVDVATLNQSPPSDRPHAYFLTLSGQSTSDMMSSPQLMRSISAEVIENCPTVSLVSFGKAETDWSIHFGLVGNTQIEQFQCVNEPTQNRLSWGYQRCL
jgi:hypothetical protein